MGLGERTVTRGAAPARDGGIVAQALASLPDAQRAMQAWGPSESIVPADDGEIDETPTPPAAAPAEPPTRNTSRPGTHAQRAIAHLQALPSGAEVVTTQLAEAVGIDPTSLRHALANSLKAGLIFSRQPGGHSRSPIYWSLVDHGTSDSIIPTPAATHLLPIANTLPRSGRARHSPGVDLDAVHRRRDNVIEMEEPKGLAGASRGPETAKETTHAGAGRAADVLAATGAGDDAKREVGPASPGGPSVDAITLTVRVATLHQAERVMQLVREMAG